MDFGTRIIASLVFGAPITVEEEQRVVLAGCRAITVDSDNNIQLPPCFGENPRDHFGKVLSDRVPQGVHVERAVDVLRKTLISCSAGDPETEAWKSNIRTLDALQPNRRENRQSYQGQVAAA